MSQGWIGVDLDGTLAEYGGWISIEHIGRPIPAMQQRVKDWLADGVDVRIFTARVCELDEKRDMERARAVIEAWCLQHLGKILPITNQKDFGMRELWDDRAVQVEANTGHPIRLADLEGEEAEAMEALLRFYNIVRGWGSNPNELELIGAVHVCQGFITQRMLARVAPGHWADWYGEEEVLR